MSTSSLFAIITLIFIVASNMDYVDAEKLRNANASPVGHSDKGLS